MQVSTPRSLLGVRIDRQPLIVDSVPTCRSPAPSDIVTTGCFSVLGLGRVIVFATLTFGTGLVAFGLSTNVWISLAILPVVGAGFMIQTASTNTIIQTIVEEHFFGLAWCRNP